MKSQTPAQGILVVNKWGSSIMYKVVCECGDDDCSHTVDIEADDSGIVVTVYATTRTNFWSMNRWSHMWKLLTTGYVETSSSLHMSQQVALNYASVLQSAMKDVEQLRNKGKKDANSI